MSGPGPFGDDDPFAGMPFLGDLRKLLGGLGGSGLQWDAARQVAMQTASGGASEPNIDPIERLDIEQLARVAELHVAGKTGLATSHTGHLLTVVPVTRAQWVQRSLDAFRPLFESLASSLTSSSPGPPADETDPLSAMLGQLMGAMAPMMLGVTAGGMIGHLATRSFGQYDLPIPRPPGDELMLVLPNLDEFADGWTIDRADLRLWACLHEVTHHAVLGVPHVRAALDRMIREYASGFRPDPNALVERLGSLELTDVSQLGELQQLLSDPEVLLGAVQTDDQRSQRRHLDTLVAVVVGYVDHVLDQIGPTLLSSYTMLSEATRRRRVQASRSDRFVADLFGLDIGQATYDAGEAFVDGVVDRAGFEALDPLWRAEQFLPTPAELTAPGLWLARIDL